jgi:hypothetical protein
VLRRIEEAAREARAFEPENRRVWLDIVGRVIAKAPPAEPETSAPPDEPRLIIP